MEIPAVAANAVCRMGTDELELELELDAATDADAEEVDLEVAADSNVTFEGLAPADLLLTAVALALLNNFAFVFLTRLATLETNRTDMINGCVCCSLMWRGYTGKEGNKTFQVVLVD